MQALGFKYEIRKKGYYVDGHEKPSTIAYWKAFCERYLGYEARLHPWVQTTENIAKQIEEEGGEITRGSGYYYLDEVRKEKMVSFGRDESIYKQFLITKKTWIGPDGERNIIPKDDGLGVMVSAFQSQEFGFGFVVSEVQLKEVNEKRKKCSVQGFESRRGSRGMQRRL